MIFARRFDLCPVFTLQEFGNRSGFLVLGIRIQNPLLAGGRLFGDDLFDQFPLLSLLFRTQRDLPVQLRAVCGIPRLFPVCQIVVVVDQIGDAQSCFRPFQNRFNFAVRSFL